MLGLFSSVSLFSGDSLFIDGLGGAFHLWFGSFIGMQTMKTRVVFHKVMFELKVICDNAVSHDQAF